MLIRMTIFAVLTAGLVMGPELGKSAEGEVRVDATLDGIAVYPLEEQTWRSKVMSYPGRIKQAPRHWSGPDFFTFEYGAPLDFEVRDLVREYGYVQRGKYRVEDGRMVFTTGKRGFAFGFGGIAGESTRPSNRFGVCWGRNQKDRLRVRMVLEQDRPTRWVFALTKRMRKEFTIPGTGRREFEADTFFVRNLSPRVPIRGCVFTCLTPGVTVRIKSIFIAPSSANVYFRKHFQLKDKPVLAHATFQTFPVYDLYINGMKVDRGTRLYPSGPQKTIDLKPYLRQGENVIAFRNEFLSWFPYFRTDWRFEGVAINRDGDITRILGDNTWRCSLEAGNNWMQPGYNDAEWQSPKLKPYTNGMDRVRTPVSKGLNPRHMGMLDISLINRPYPVFDCRENPVFRARLPINVHDRYSVRLLVFKGGTNDLVETATGEEPELGQDFITWRVSLKTRTVGPYRLMWQMVDKGGKIIERRREEMVVVGPIVQDRVKLANFEEELAKRLELMRKIDCAKKPDNPADFLDHAGMYNAPIVNKGRIIHTGKLNYRETGGGCFDYFAYRIDLFRERGKPHIIEVIIPDDKERYIYSGVMEMHPIRYGNNSGRRANIASTGSCLTGGRFPLTRGTRKIRYLYYPSSATAAVMVMSGRKDSRAAACAINIYRVKGGLPALSVPQTDRLFGTHNERLSVLCRTLACDNPIENDFQVRRSGHRDAWLDWYRMFERKIRLLRFQGRNFTIEGLFMYTKTDYPSPRNSWGCSNQEFDPAYLGFKMYSRNNIRCMIGLEYMCNPAMVVADVDTVSDRRMWEGAPVMQKVDRYGRQLASMKHAGVNFLHPTVEKYFMDILQEMRDRYGDNAAIRGLFLVVGNWYLPGFGMCGFHDLKPIEIGYGDYTVARFERETHIHLGLDPKDPKRFGKRFDLLTGKYRQQWIEWRMRKVRGFIERMSLRLRTGTHPWQLKIYPTYKHQLLDTLQEFYDPAANREKCARAMETFLRESAFPLKKYLGDPFVQLVTPLVTIGFKGRLSGERVVNHRAWDLNPGALSAVRRINSFYLNTALDEVDCPAKAAPKWPWKGTTRGVFVARGAEDNYMNGFVNVMARTTPRLVISQWMDCNMETGHGKALRRFALEHYVTPDADFIDLPTSQTRGVIAQVAPRPEGGVFLRLVNNSPYTSSGTINTGTPEALDLVYEHALPARETGVFSARLQPNDIRTFALPGAASAAVRCDFAFAPEVNTRILARAKAVVDNQAVFKSLPRDKAAILATALQAGDGFGAYLMLDDFEIHGRIKLVMRREAARANQKKLLADLAATNAVRIDFAAISEHKDARGNRWLPDQEYLDCGAYGNTGAKFVDRGNIPIANTDLDRVYQTEAYGGKVTYRIPLPNGTYNVMLYVAETYDKIKASGIRLFSVQIQEHLWPQKLDPFDRAGGFATALVLPQNNVQVRNGMLTLEFVGAVGVQGVVIERIK